MDAKVRTVIESIIRNIPEVAAIILFGSRARGDARNDSDYDLAVVLSQYRKEIEDKLLTYGTEKVDISVFNTLPPAVKMEVLREGKCLFVRSEDVLRREEAFAISEFLDIIPLYRKFGVKT